MTPRDMLGKRLSLNKLPADISSIKPLLNKYAKPKRIGKVISKVLPLRENSPGARTKC